MSNKSTDFAASPFRKAFTPATRCTPTSSKLTFDSPFVVPSHSLPPQYDNQNINSLSNNNNNNNKSNIPSGATNYNLKQTDPYSAQTGIQMIQHMTVQQQQYGNNNNNNQNNAQNNIQNRTRVSSENRSMAPMISSTSMNKPRGSMNSASHTPTQKQQLPLRGGGLSDLISQSTSSNSSTSASSIAFMPNLSTGSGNVEANATSSTVTNILGGFPPASAKPSMSKQHSTSLNFVGPSKSPLANNSNQLLIREPSPSSSNTISMSNSNTNTNAATIQQHAPSAQFAPPIHKHSTSNGISSISSTKSQTTLPTSHTPTSQQSYQMQHSHMGLGSASGTNIRFTHSTTATATSVSPDEKKQQSSYTNVLNSSWKVNNVSGNQQQQQQSTPVKQNERIALRNLTNNSNQNQSLSANKVAPNSSTSAIKGNIKIASQQQFALQQQQQQSTSSFSPISGGTQHSQKVQQQQQQQSLVQQQESEEVKRLKLEIEQFKSREIKYLVRIATLEKETKKLAEQSEKTEAIRAQNARSNHHNNPTSATTIQESSCQNCKGQRAATNGIMVSPHSYNKYKTKYSQLREQHKDTLLKCLEIEKEQAEIKKENEIIKSHLQNSIFNQKKSSNTDRSELQQPSYFKLLCLASNLN